jgi:anti-sigma regulatory factor (Ser/Thr protein kinase)
VIEPVELRASVVLRAVPQSAGAARRFIANICNAAELAEEDCALAALLTSELVTNAVRYGGSRAVIDAQTPGGVLRVSVRDDNPALPVVGAKPEFTKEGGRGLQVVDALASRWGVEEAAGGGKAVWFELDLTRTADDASV